MLEVKHEQARSGSMPFVSIVIPTYNEEPVIKVTNERVQTVMDHLGFQYEIIYVNDGSRDHTLQELIALAVDNPIVKIIDLSRNFGHQIAVSAGLECATGDVVVLMDADLQDPPELIEQFMEKWQEGYDVVYAVRMEREGESALKKWTAHLFYRTMRRWTDIDIPLDTGDFRLMDRLVVDSLVAIRERHRFIRGLVSWVGYRQIGVPYVRAKRYAGESKYPLKKMVQFSLDGITSFSFKPLQLATKLGFTVATCGFVSVLVILYLKIFTNSTLQGWASLMVLGLFLGGIQLLIFGIFGEYLGRIYDEVRARPLYFVKNQYNLDDRMSRSKHTE